MKIAIDISPLESGHKVRGVGFYLEHLKKALLTYDSENNYVFFSGREKIDPSVDLVHYPYFDPFFLTLPFSQRHKTVVTVHDLTPLVFPRHFPAGIRGSINWNIQKHLLKKSLGVIADSQASKDDVVNIAGITTEKVDVVYLAAGEEFKKFQISNFKFQIAKKYNLPEKFVLYVGDATWNKNLPRLIMAIQEINLTLVMVGKALGEKDFDASHPWNKGLAEVNRLAAGDKRIIRLGFVPTEDVVSLYNAATVFVMPSLYEGFGLPVLEAMQCGCPVVTTKGGSLAEVAGDAAFFVNEHEVESIANGIGEVFFTSKLQADLSKKGLQQARKFSWKKTAEKTVEAYEKVLSRK